MEKTKSQIDRFEEAARDLGADTDDDNALTRAIEKMKTPQKEANDGHEEKGDADHQ